MMAAATRSFARNPMDWDCPNPQCGNVNFARREVCNLCNSPRPRAGGFASVPYPGATFGAAGGRFEPQPGDWACSGCGNVNWARRDSCNRCAAPRATQAYTMPGAMMSARGPAPPPASQIAPGDWPCGSCGNLNWARRPNCNLCQSPRPFGGGMMFGAPMMMMGGVPGDWTCPACANVNFARREACNRCQTPKPAGMAAMDGGFRKSFKMMAGDWPCPDTACGNVNFARRTTCNRCGAAKP